MFTELTQTISLTHPHDPEQEDAIEGQQDKHGEEVAIDVKIIFLNERTHHHSVVEDVMALQTVIGNPSCLGLKIVAGDCHFKPGPDNHNHSRTS